MTHGFLSSGFIAINAILLLAGCVTAAFFQFQGYLSHLGISPEWAGLIIGADSIAALVLQPLLAPFLNERNGRLTIVSGLLVMALALVLYRGADSVTALFFVRFLQGAGFICIISALMALVVCYIPSDLSGRAFGLLSLIRLVPYAIVPPALTYVMTDPVQFPHILFFGAVIMIACLGGMFFLRRGDAFEGAFQGTAGFRGMGETMKDRVMVMLLAVNFFVYIGYTVVFFYLSGYGRRVGIANPGFFFSTATVAMIVIRALGSSFFDRVRKGWAATWCLAGLCPVFVCLGFVRSHAAFFMLAIAFGIGWGILMPLLTAIVFDLSPARLRGMNINLVMVMLQAAFFVGPALGGLMLKSGGYPVLFGSCGALSLAALVLIAATDKPRGGAVNGG